MWHQIELEWLKSMESLMMCIKIDIENQNRKYNKMQMSCVWIHQTKVILTSEEVCDVILYSKFNAHLMSGYLHFNKVKQPL